MASQRRFDPTAFVFGVLFITIAGVGLLTTAMLRTVNFAQLVPAVLIIAGVALLASTLRARAREDDADPTMTATFGP